MSKQKKARPASESPARPMAADDPAAARLDSQLPLKILVFWAGAVLMGLEIAGSRVLAPHFGNSVFVWGSLISVFLIALSAGYYLGGRIADLRPSRTVLNTICMAVSVWIFGVALLSYSFCEALAQTGLGEQSGPLVASLVLFLAPGIGMGMVSPYAVRLAAHSVSSVGQIAGTLYALSTVGSIVGTILTTFVLVPLIGLSAILKGLGIVLLVVSVFTLPTWRRNGVPMLVVLFGMVALAFLVPSRNEAALLPGEKLVVDAETPYQHVSVVDSARRNARDLRFDRYVESSISLAPPYPALANYTDYFHLALLLKPDIQRTLFIGAGGGIGPRSFHQHNRQMEIDVVDIDPMVLKVAREHFFLPEVPHVRSIAQDGRMFLAGSPQPYDCIVLDAFTIGGRIPFHLVTKEFLELCRRHLTDNGVFVMNINSSLEGPNAAIFRSMQATIDAVFATSYVFVKGHRQIALTDSTNVLLVASKDAARLSAEQWSQRAAAYRSESFVGSYPVQRCVEDLVSELPDLSNAIPFTDDYAPIETMPF
jgi:spermidine synthase